MSYKKIPTEYFQTILDRLTRFEPAYVRYKRVLDDLINKFAPAHNFKISELTTPEKIKIAEYIINYTFENNQYLDKNTAEINEKLNKLFIELEEKYFKFNEESYQYLSNRFNYYALIKNYLKINKIPKNVLWLEEIIKTNLNLEEIVNLRNNNGLLYPIEKIILCEGQTEELLIKPIFKLFNIDLDSLGVKVISAGGKNQVARKYYSMIEYSKTPFCILLDKDASAIKDLIEPKLREIDSLYLLNSGEFEDLIPRDILQKTINFIHKNDYNCIFDDFLSDSSMVHNLENIYKN